MMIKRYVRFGTVTATVAIVLAIVFTTGNGSHEEVRAKHRQADSMTPVELLRNAELNNMLKQSRYRIVENLTRIEPEVIKWELTDLGDLPSRVTQMMDEREAYSFTGIIIHIQKEWMEFGDYIPAVLMNPTKDRAFIIWERSDGESAFVEIQKNREDKVEVWDIVNKNV